MDFTIIADKNSDQTELKTCRRCAKLGRMNLFPIENFSLLQTGKRHTYCKKCRTEQQTEWAQKKAAERAEYQRAYRNNSTPVYLGTVYKRRANKPLVREVQGSSLVEAYEIEVAGGELIARPKFDNLFFAVNCGAVRITLRPEKDSKTGK